MIQPLDVYGFGIWKNFVRKFSDLVLLFNYDVQLKQGIMPLSYSLLFIINFHDKSITMCLLTHSIKVYNILLRNQISLKIQYISLFHNKISYYHLVVPSAAIMLSYDVRCVSNIYVFNIFLKSFTTMKNNS